LASASSSAFELAASSFRFPFSSSSSDFPRGLDEEPLPMIPVEPPDGRKLEGPAFEPPNPDPSALPNPVPPRLPVPDAVFAAKGDAPRKPEDEPKPLLSLGPKDPNPEPEPGPEEPLRFPNGDFEELANAESPDDANAEDDVCCFSWAAGSGSDVGFTVGGDLDDARDPKGDRAEVLANPERFST
jgi:hypothetical protein